MAQQQQQLQPNQTFSVVAQQLLEGDYIHHVSILHFK
jgi:hypothetical protein